MNQLEHSPASTHWAAATVESICREVINVDGLLDRAAQEGVIVFSTYDWFNDNRMKRLTIYVRTRDGTPDVILGSVERDDHEPFREDLRELFEQVRRQLQLLL